MKENARSTSVTSEHVLHLVKTLNEALLILLNTEDKQQALRNALIKMGVVTHSAGVFLQKDAPSSTYALIHRESFWEEETSATSVADFSTQYKIEIATGGQLIFAQNSDQYQWTEAEKEVMQSFAITLGTFLQKNKSGVADFEYARRVVDTIPSLVYVKDRKGNFRMVNKAVCDAYGIEEADLIGRSNEDFYPNKDQFELFRKWETEVYETGQMQVHYLELALSDEMKLYVQCVKKPIFNDKGEVDGILGVINDLSYQKEIEQSILDQKYLSDSITKIIPDTILIIDVEQMELVSANVEQSFLGWEIKSLEHPLQFFKEKIHPEDYPEAISNLFRSAAASENNEVLEAEVRIQNKEGDWHWYKERLRVFSRNEKGEATTFLMVLQDINNDKRSRERLAESEQRYRDFIEYSSDGIYFSVCGKDGISIDLPIAEQVKAFYENNYIEECNLAFAKMYGYEKVEDITGQPTYQLHEGHFEDYNVEAVKAFLENGFRSHNVETIETSLDGAYKHFLNNAIGIVRDGHLVGVWGTQQDITEHKKAEKALNESQERMDMVVKGANLGIWDWDIKSGEVAYNKYWAEMLGFQLEELAPNLETFLELIHPDDRGTVWGLVQHHINYKTSHFEGEFRMRTKDGDWKWIYDRGRVMVWGDNETPLRALGTHMDITDRKKADVALRESEEFFRNLFEESPLAIAFVNMEGGIFRVNEQFCKMLGYDNDQIIGKELTEFYFEEEDIFHVLAGEAEKQDKSRIRFEKQMRGNNGRPVWARVAMGFIEDTDGNFKHIICMAEDITDRVQAQHGLSEREELNQAILKALPDLKFRINRAGMFLSYYASEQEDSNLYTLPEEFLGRNIQEVLPAYISSAAIYNTNLAIRDKEVKTFEYMLPDGDVINFFEARISAINDNEVIIVVRNITALKNAQNSLQEKLKELDVKNKQLKEYIDSNMQLENFAYIASHDLREPVRTMRSFAQLLDQKYRDKLDESASKYIRFIIESADHMNRLIQDLLTYSRIDTEEHEITDVDLSSTIEFVLRGLKELINEKQAVISVPENLPVVEANKTKMEQLFQNLINNAIKFHKQGQSPKIEVMWKELEAHWEFRIKDDGIGISPEFFDKIFVLFKKLHRRGEYQGTGLGLAICKKIIEQHHGRIQVESMPDLGTTFIFTIRKNLKSHEAEA
ncbi:MAG: PAS domain S-box protein [Saprospiraceae bacterium]|nr:PAS domain S-box protein [Saprospiraceae bacterium]